MTTGPVLGRMLLFALPMSAAGILQLLYNAFDMIIVGKFDSSTALAAVGATSAVINLITCLFMGIALGAGVVVAQDTGAKRDDEVSRSVHTAMLVAVIGGVLLCAAGIALARPALTWMGTPADVLDSAALYMVIYFIGVPATMIYNFGTAVLRAVGDSRRPLYFLLLAGLVNIALNYVLVVCAHMGVAGVAWATVVSQTLSAALTTACLLRAKGAFRLELRKLHIYPDKLWSILRIGVPSGLQSALFSISNVLIQSTINSFGSAAMAGNTAASSIEGFVNASVGGISQAGTTFTSQNFGARKPRRIARVALVTSAMAFALAAALGFLEIRFGPQLLGIYTSDAEVVRFGMLRLTVMASTFAIWALMNVTTGLLQGMGRSTAPMIISVAGVCLLRIVWLYTVFPLAPTLPCLYISYPVSWGITWLVEFILFLFVLRKFTRVTAAEEAEAAQISSE